MPVTAVSVIMGVLVTVQWRSQAESRLSSVPSRRVEDLVVLLKTTEKSNQQLGEQVHQLQDQMLRQAPKPDQWPADAPHITEYPPVAGQGLVVSVLESSANPQLEDGTSAVVHAEDLLKIVNELRTGGAEAVALNGHRLTETSEIVTAGQHVVVNKVSIKGPYRIEAIGPADDMKNTLGLRGGVVEYLQFYGIKVDTKARQRLELPGAGHARIFKFAQPVVIEEAAKPTD